MSSGTSKGKEGKGANLGRLSALGVKELHQLPLLLPSTWDDLTRVIDRFADLEQLLPGDTCVVAGRLDGPPSVKFTDGKPMLKGYLEDPCGAKLGFSTFGDSRKFEEDLRSQADRVFLIGKIEVLGDGRAWLKAPELVPEEWLGRLRPKYPGKAGVVKPETVRERVLPRLKEAIPLAADFLARELASFGSREGLAELAGLPRWSLEAMLDQAHRPRTLEHGRKAQEGLERLAALGIIASASGGQAPRPCSSVLDLPDWRPLAASIPFGLTSEQEQAISDSLADIGSGYPMHRIISGDVGTGKTAVMAVIAAAVVEAGGNVACLLPNETLAVQIFNEVTGYWPDLPVQLLTGSHRDDALCGSMVIGTTAVLHQDLGHVNLVLTDEQQKLGTSQREQLVGPDTHLLEMTATCIPRSQALIRYGVVKVSRLTKNHTKKTIYTRIWQKDEVSALFAWVKKTLAAGDQVLLVYPLREKGEEDPDAETPAASKKIELKNVVDEFGKWDRLFPGQVRLAHGQMAATDKEAALDDMREGRASILVATTVVEVGINIPRLRRIVIVHPDRHGLSALHQMRGRVARKGGEGWCDLYLPYPVKEKTMERLRVLVNTTDGFEVAFHDMLLRGIGNLSKGSGKQSGADDTFLFGRGVNIEILDEMMEKCRGEADL